jgi:hypothetical protein
MNECVVYSGGVEHVVTAMSLLRSHGVPCRVLQCPAIGLPWVSLASPRPRVAVPERLAARARDLLQPLEAAEARSVAALLRVVRWRLLAVGIWALGAFVCIMGAGTGRPVFAFGSAACVAMLVVSWRRLRRPARTRNAQGTA